LNTSKAAEKLPRNANRRDLRYRRLSLCVPEKFGSAARGGYRYRQKGSDIIRLGIE
jgi:hypothetical protein